MKSKISYKDAFFFFFFFSKQAQSEQVYVQTHTNAFALSGADHSRRTLAIIYLFIFVSTGSISCVCFAMKGSPSSLRRFLFFWSITMIIIFSILIAFMVQNTCVQLTFISAFWKICWSGFLPRVRWEVPKPPTHLIATCEALNTLDKSASSVIIRQALMSVSEYMYQH